jgi:hypothetical protein
MLPLVCLLLVAAPHVDVTDEVYEIPANDWRWVEISLTQRTGVVSARYVVLSGAGAVRAALLPKEQVKTLRSGDGLDDFDPTAAAAAGELKRPTREPGVYAVVVENRSPGPASVRLRVAVDFPVATTISSQRQLTVIVISFAVFFAIVGFSARRLLRAVRRE